MFVFDTACGVSKSDCGSKGNSLNELFMAGFNVPQWFAVSPRAFRHSLSDEQNAAVEALDDVSPLSNAATVLAGLFDDFSLAPEVEQEINVALASKFADGTLFAVRSSSAEEDGVEQSFAGQFETFLCVPRELLIEKIIAVWKSSLAERVMVYRRERGLKFSKIFPSVLIQEMVNADAAGVAFSADPVSGDTSLSIVEAVTGLGEGLVSGQLDVDSWTLNLEGVVLHERIAEKNHAVRFDSATGHGTGLVEVEESNRHIPSISANDVSFIASLSRAAEAHFGCPQDIEWCIRDSQIFLLQSRPITTLKISKIESDASPLANNSSNLGGHVSVPAKTTGAEHWRTTDKNNCGSNSAFRSVVDSLQTENTLSGPSVECVDPARDMNIWDCSNISESYPGVTTPLTFTFAKNAYEHVYREFLRLMGVRPSVIERFSHVFPCMLGLVRGRMYYNLPSWFRLLSLLPGFGKNARHMETMMGLKEPLPESIMHQIKYDTAASTPGVLATVWAACGLGWSLLALKDSVSRFYKRVDEALKAPPQSLEKKSAIELGQYYRELESKLLKKWDAPITNDFFAMIFYGVLRNLCSKWCGDLDGSLQNRLISQQSGIISAEPARRIKRMASLACVDQELVHILCYGTTRDAVHRLQQHPILMKEYEDYLEVFGDRCLEELKLETPTLNDAPELLLRSVGVVATQAVPPSTTTLCGVSKASVGSDPRSRLASTTSDTDEAFERVAQLNPIKRAVFYFVLSQAKERIKQRENLRFLRTRVFGRVRRIFIELGKKLCAAGVLLETRDIFYLEVEELLSYLEGTATCNALSTIVAARKTEFDQFRTEADPPVRIVTMGLPHISMALTAQNSSDDLDLAQVTCQTDVPLPIKGIPCSPGKVRGRVRIITDPANVRMEMGDIIVARRTDPGWILLFPAASGLIVEHGSLLSHSAIVSRELGLPAIVGVCNVTRVLREGDVVQFDGKTGIIEVVERAQSIHVCVA